MQDSSQYILPFLSLIPTKHDPRKCHDFTLNQFNIAVVLDREALDVSQLHFYTYDATFFKVLPRLLKKGWGSRLTPHVLRRLSVAFGYLPSWASPSLTLRLRPGKQDTLPELLVSGRPNRPLANHMMRAVLSRLLRAAPYLDLWPLVPLLSMSAPAKSYHFGGSFPHSNERESTRLTSDVLGRIGPWRRIHAIDGSVLPTIGATTFTLTLMANAHRIADAALKSV